MVRDHGLSQTNDSHIGVAETEKSSPGKWGERSCLSYRHEVSLWMHPLKVNSVPGPTFSIGESMFLSLEELGPCRLDRIIPKPLCMAIILAALMLQFGCKTQGSGVTAIADSLPATLGCGPDRTFYFHWMSIAAAQAWLKDAGAPAAANVSSLQAASSPDYPLDPATINYLIRNYTEGAAGPGVYVSAEPLGTKNFGETLLIFRYRDDQGKGLPCADWRNDTPAKRELSIQAKASPDLPVLARYGLAKQPWFVTPRAPIASRGEHVVFSLPRIGDADAFVSEVTKQVSLDTFIDSFVSLYQYSARRAQSCSTRPTNGSEMFVQDLYCRAFVVKLSQFLATASLKASSAAQRTGLGVLIATFQSLAVSPELLSPIVSTGVSPCGTPAANIRSSQDLNAVLACPILTGNFSISIDEQNGSLKALSEIEEISGNLDIVVKSFPFSFKSLAKLKSVGRLSIKSTSGFADCNTTMALKDVQSLNISGASARDCIAQFPDLTKVGTLIVEGYDFGGNHPAFTDLSGFKRLQTVDSLYLDGILVTDLNFLNQIQSIQTLTLSKLSKLRSLQPLLSHNPFAAGGKVRVRDVPMLSKGEIDSLAAILHDKGIRED